jgi:RsmE family RNA methyltransferase
MAPAKGGLKSPVLLAVGPEGGFVEYECARFAQEGFTAFSMGPRILHVDTAVVALLAQLNLLLAASDSRP